MIELKTYYGPFTGYDLSRLSGVRAYYQSGRSRTETRPRFNQVFVMADTETSKTDDFDEAGHRINHIVCWSVALRYDGRNVFAVYGRRPFDLCIFLEKMHDSMPGDRTIITFHNMTYDWQFMRKFFIAAYGDPIHQLNTKAHYPINIEFRNGIILRDTLILAQVSLDRWGRDMQVEHGKLTGGWDYEKRRDQDTPLTDEELEYIYDDVLCGVECLDKLATRLHKFAHTLPWTMTGIPREMTRKIGKKHAAHDDFLKCSFSYDDYLHAEMTYHGGYTHANRYVVNRVHRGEILPFDFASSYPFAMISERYPAEKFHHCPDTSIEGILRYKEDFAFMFLLITTRIELRDPHFPMPYLQASKCQRMVNAIFDNGRILEADAVAIWLTEVDLEIIHRQYKIEGHICKEVMYAKKEYLPRWFTDLVWQQYVEKQKLKKGDPTDYALAKARLNSLYGMCCQKLIRPIIEERYATGEFIESEEYDPEAAYEKQCQNKGQVLHYQTGIWVTAYACRNLFDLGECGETWLYSDTDSCYFEGVKPGAIEAYNQRALEKLRANGYDLLTIEGKTYQLGAAEPDGVYSEFITVGSKRYAKRNAKTGELTITVAGVPKKGAQALEDDISRFKRGMIFPGTLTGKLAHFYTYIEEIYIDAHGNEQGDYIDLDPCDYLLDDIFGENLLNEEVHIPIYEEREEIL